MFPAGAASTASQVLGSPSTREFLAGSLMSRVTQQSTVVASERQVSSDLGGEAVILQLESGVYHGLNEVGAAIWALLREPRTVEEIQEAILAEFAVDAERCQRDVLSLLRGLEAEGLIEVLDAGRDKRDDTRTQDAADR
jgi:hypothetical protein